VSGSADRQRDILNTATGLIGPGGELVYSTCTFNQTENEGVVAAVLAGNGDWHVGERRRLWPHLVRGEGHVVHRLGRAGSEPSGNPERRDRLDDPAARLAWDAFSHEHFSSNPIAHLPGKLEWRDHRLMLATGHELDLSRIAVVRDGLWLGERKPGRFEPSHALALAIDPALATNRLDLEVEAARRWIGGEPVAAAGPAGWVLITVDGFGLGWGKRSASIVKNHYPKGLRRVSREA
jgi:NOL1/NOP2/fmu family ribosome biogenesis protein